MNAVFFLTLILASALTMPLLGTPLIFISVIALSFATLLKNIAFASFSQLLVAGIFLFLQPTLGLPLVIVGLGASSAYFILSRFFTIPTVFTFSTGFSILSELAHQSLKLFYTAPIFTPVVSFVTATLIAFGIGCSLGVALLAFYNWLRSPSVSATAETNVAVANSNAAAANNQSVNNIHIHNHHYPTATPTPVGTLPTAFVGSPSTVPGFSPDPYDQFRTQPAQLPGQGQYPFIQDDYTPGPELSPVTRNPSLFSQGPGVRTQLDVQIGQPFYPASPSQMIEPLNDNLLSGPAYSLGSKT